MRKILLTLIVIIAALNAQAQRVTDQLDRGVVAVKVTGGVFVSWRIQSDEYYDVTYNLYRNGSLIAENLQVSNFKDVAGTASSTYTVEAVKRGVKQAMSGAATTWKTNYLDIVPKHDASIKSTLVPNDACCADVDGDGVVEILMKYDNHEEIVNGFPKNGNNGEYTIFECLKLDGTVLWWVNCGPNMGDFQNNEQNIVGYDWDMDGKAEVLMRLEEGSVIHMADGTTYTFGADGKNGTAWTNYRSPKTGGVEWFTHYGNEFLVYCNGETGVPYQVMDFPCARFESGETDLNKAWGDGYGHRSSKFFFGAPYLDGRKPSIFVGRGIYTRHKFVALDVNPTTHKLKERWRWMNNTNGPWKGQGYHNYAIVDVDWDGRDEIVWGSMVIDDNGKGLSTTGLGHGDAQHHGDLDPYKHGQEGFFCNEDRPSNNYRDLTTSKIYYRVSDSRDDGRCIAGNFLNTVPGAVGFSAHDAAGPVSLVASKHLDMLNTTAGMAQNFRCYWDGDLQEETFNYSSGKNTAGAVYKPGSGVSWLLDGSMTNNDTKGTPCFMGDILGDWREEFIMRTPTNGIRIYTTNIETPWRNYSLWYDHQYRNGMVWEMCGYNQPPHVSYFLGELEGITVAPPPLTMTGRTEVTDGGTIGSSLNGQHAIVCETGNSSVTIEAGAQPEVLTFNVPSWVQGTAASESTTQNTKINYTTYTCTVSGGGLSGDGRLVKQGDGILTLPKADFTHTGATDVWAGTLNFDGTMKQSPLWLNRLTQLNSDGGVFKSIKADYGATIRPGGADKQGTITTDTLALGFGSRLALDLYSDGLQADVVKTKVLKIERKKGSAWTQGGPEYLMPVIELTGHLAEGETLIATGKYVIAEVSEIDGALEDLIVEGVNTQKKNLIIEDGKLMIEIVGMRDAAAITWSGAEGAKWDVGESQNFTIGADQESTAFVSGDEVTFDDQAASKIVTIATDVYPSKITVSNTSGTYTFGGSGAISGKSEFVKENGGIVIMNGENSYTGGNHLRGGVTKIKKLANQYSATGNLGGITTVSDLFTIENGATLQATEAIEQGSPMKMLGDEGGIIDNSGDFIVSKAIFGTVLTKKGTGWMKLGLANSSLSKLVIAQGVVQCTNCNTPAKAVEFQGGELRENTGTSYAISVPKGKSGTWYMANRSTYTNKVTGEGTLTAYCVTEKGSNYYATRTPVQCDFSAFEGKLVPTSSLDDPAVLRFTLNTATGMPKGTMDIAEKVEVQNSGKTYRIGKVTGKGKLGGTCTFSNGGNPGANTWQVGNDDDWTTNVRVSSNANFVKVGKGAIRWSGASDNTGTTTISEGELRLASGAQLGTGALKVNEGAVLGGSTTAKTPLVNSSFTINGMLRPGASPTATTGTLYFNNKAVTVSNTGVLVIRAASTLTHTSLGDVSKLTINGTIRLELSESHTLQAGDEIRLWPATTTLAGTPKIELPEGLTCDVSRISEGVIVVTAVSTGIDAARLSKNGQDVYDLNGRKVSSEGTDGLPAGVYICGGKKVIITK